MSRKQRPASFKRVPTARQLYDLSLELGRAARSIRQLSHKVATYERDSAVLFARAEKERPCARSLGEGLCSECSFVCSANPKELFQ